MKNINSPINASFFIYAFLTIVISSLLFYGNEGSIFFTDIFARYFTFFILLTIFVYKLPLFLKKDGKHSSIGNGFLLLIYSAFFVIGLMLGYLVF